MTTFQTRRRIATGCVIATLVCVASAAASKRDGTARQTAPAWTGSAIEFEYPNRDKTLQIDYVMDAMGLKPGSVVADIGAGGGWFTMRAAKRVGPSGTVYAEEILPKYTKFIAHRASRAGLKNVRTVLGSVTDPRLPVNALDAALILNAYHEFGSPIFMLRQIARSLKVGGRLAFIERDTPALRSEARMAYRKTGKIKRRVDEDPDKNPVTDDHRLAREVIEREVTSIGLRCILKTDLRDDNYLLIAVKDK